MGGYCNELKEKDETRRIEDYWVLIIFKITNEISIRISHVSNADEIVDEIFLLIIYSTAVSVWNYWWKFFVTVFIGKPQQNIFHWCFRCLFFFFHFSSSELKIMELGNPPFRNT